MREPDGQAVIAAFLRGADQALGEGYAAVLYGSAARGTIVPGRSDLNLLLVVPSLDADRLTALQPHVTALARGGGQPPLLFDAEEWAAAAEVFPIEIADMRLAYKVLRGADPVAPLLVRPGDLRHALEHELRGLVLRLRQALASHPDDTGLLGRIVGGTGPGFRVLLRALIVLEGAVPPDDDEGLAGAVARTCGFSADDVMPVLAHRRDPDWSCDRERFARYLGAAVGAAAHVDTRHEGTT